MWGKGREEQEAVAALQMDTRESPSTEALGQHAPPVSADRWLAYFRINSQWRDPSASLI